MSETTVITKKKIIKNKYVKGRENNHLPHDPEYFNKYYHDQVKENKVICDVCSCCVVKNRMIRHKKGKKCMLIALEKQKEETKEQDNNVTFDI
jgi:hypothetical protein